MSTTKASIDVTDAMLDSISTVRDSLARTGCDHRIFIEPPAEWDDVQNVLYVTGHRHAGLDRCAIVYANGEIEWIR